MIKKIYYSSRFKKKFEIYSRELRLEIIEEINLFQEDPLNSSLNTHPLHEKLVSSYSFSLGHGLRIMFKFMNQEHTEVIFIDIGGHEIYK